MTVLARQDLDRSLAAGKVQSLYLLVGCETYLRDAAARTISDAALSGTLLREFNETSFSLLADSAMSAIAAAEQLPMMSERRVVRIRILRSCVRRTKRLSFATSIARWTPPCSCLSPMISTSVKS